MSKFLRYSLILLTLASLALSSVAHEISPSHDSSECSVCIYQPNTDLHTVSAQSVTSISFSISEPVITWFVLVVDSFKVSPFLGRAPPIQA